MDTNFKFIADGEKIKKLRIEKGYRSTYELAKYVGVLHQPLQQLNKELDPIVM